jgi:hypothetical protein
MGLFSKPKQNSSMPPAPSMPLPAAPAMPKPTVDLSRPPVVDSSMQRVPMAPPLPEDSLREVKWQVGAPSPISLPEPSDFGGEIPVPAMSQSSDEGLFDLSDLSMDGLESPAQEQQQVSQMQQSQSAMQQLTYAPNKHSRKVSNEPYYVTTAQFKRMLEIVEEVKVKVKETSEIHLRLMDIKSEEDIEYENLRKNFQFIEDKLYEVDSIIFEK